MAGSTATARARRELDEAREEVVRLMEKCDEIHKKYLRESARAEAATADAAAWRKVALALAAVTR